MHFDYRRQRLRSVTTLALSLCLALVATELPAKPVAATAINTDNSPDPAMIKVGSSSYYQFRTGGSVPCGGDKVHFVPRRATSNFPNFTNCYDDALPGGPGAGFCQTESYVWAPHVVYNHLRTSDKYQLFFSARLGSCSGPFCIRVAFSSTASGAFANPVTVKCATQSSNWVIDPEVIRVSNKYYLQYREDIEYLGTIFRVLQVVELNASGNATVGSSRLLHSSYQITWDKDTGTNPLTDGTIENPSLLLGSNGNYYINFSGDYTPNLFTGLREDYATGLGVCGTTLLTGAACSPTSSTNPYYGWSNRSPSPAAAPSFTFPGDPRGPGGLTYVRQTNGNDVTNGSNNRLVALHEAKIVSSTNIRPAMVYWQLHGLYGLFYTNV